MMTKMKMAAGFAVMIIASFGLGAVSVSGGPLSFTSLQCTTAPTGRVRQNVTAVQAAEGKPIGVVQTVTAIEYATVCDKTEWRK